VIYALPGTDCVKEDDVSMGKRISATGVPQWIETQKTSPRISLYAFLSCLAALLAQN
jgi:hypothetical protein